MVLLMASTVAVASASRGTGNRIVGTWMLDVAETEGEVPGFQTLMTFRQGGILTEVSDELGLGLQGRGHGAWTRRGGNYTATFQVWLFNPETGAAEGRIQVRAAIRVGESNTLTGISAIDFIDPAGNVNPDIDSGPFTGTRMKVVGPERLMILGTDRPASRFPPKIGPGTRPCSAQGAARAPGSIDPFSQRSAGGGSTIAPGP